MKKQLFSILFACFTIVSFSQDVRYGVRGAINISNLDFDPDANFENQHRNGFAFAGFVDYGFTEDVSLLLEVQWSAEGGKSKFVSSEFIFDDQQESPRGMSLRADYIKMPILLRLALSDRFTIGAGPQVAIKTWADRDGYSTFAFSGVAGIEYMITDELFIDTRLTYGFTNILDQDLTNASAKNHVIQFGFGMKL